MLALRGAASGPFWGPSLRPCCCAAYRELFEDACTRFAAGPDGGRVLLLELRPCR